MNSIILSCGHSVEYLEQGHDLMIKSTDCEGNKAVMYGTFCTECAIDYRKNRGVLDSWTDAEQWLSASEE